jgi:hypothetical protein
VEEHRPEQAAARLVEDRRHQHRERHVADEEWEKIPIGEHGAGQEERRHVPQSPGRADQQPGPDRRHVPLKQGLRHAAPTELLDRAEKEHHEQDRHDDPDALRRQQRQYRATLEQRSRYKDEREADQDEGHPPRRASPEEKPGQEGPDAGHARVEEHDHEGGDRGRPRREEEERMRSADLAEPGGNGIGKHDVDPDQPPSDQEGDADENEKRRGRYPGRACGTRLDWHWKSPRDPCGGKVQSGSSIARHR